MATGSQVPWTDPGGPPCCCDDLCFTDLTQPDATLSPDTYQAIASEDYTALLAGGSFTFGLSSSITSVDIDGSGSQTISLSNQAMQSVSAVSDSLPCYNQLANVTPFTVSMNDDGVSFTTTSNVRFTYALGTHTDGTKRISLASVKDVNGNGLAYIYAAPGLMTFFPTSITFIEASNLYDIPAAAGCLYATTSLPRAGVTASASLTIGGNTYSTLFMRGYICYGAQNFTETSVTGSFSLQVVFTPSAP